MRLDTEWEEWKPCYRLEKKYLISSLGRIKNRESNKILKGHYSGCGYKVLCLRISKKRKKNYKISRLLLSTFSGHETNQIAWHRNGLRWDSRLSNLEWLSKSESQKRLWAMGWNRKPKNPLKHYFKPGIRGHLQITKMVS